jgi:DoxX-like family
MKTISKPALWTSYILQGLIVLMFLMGAVNNLMQTEMAVNGAADMGYPKESVLYLGVVLLLATVLYAIPTTTFVGAILLTAWLGGAVATHIIHHDPLVNSIFPIVFGKLIWISIWLRNEKAKAVVPLTKN